MKRTTLILIILLTIALGLASAAQAQSGLLVDTVQVQLWPEYDRPSMLVILSIELSDEQPLPAPISVRIPASVGDPTAVAVLDTTGLVNREYTRSADGDWAEINLESDSRFIQVEYYDPALSQQDQPRSYEFTWSADFAVNDLIVGVKQPSTASGMQIEPNLGPGSTASDGLLTFTNSLGSIPAGQEVPVSLSYTKPDNILAIDSAPPDVISQPPVTESAAQGDFPTWGWVIIGLGVVVLAAGAIVFIRNNSTTTESSYRNKKKRTGSRSTRDKPDAGSVFCHKCGTRSHSSDKFCRECGTKLRL